MSRKTMCYLPLICFEKNPCFQWKKKKKKKKAKKHIFDLAVKDTRLHFIFLEKKGLGLLGRLRTSTYPFFLHLFLVNYKLIKID
jgi:hypothetical protein